MYPRVFVESSELFHEPSESGGVFSAPGLLLWGDDFIRECRVNVADPEKAPQRGHYLLSTRSFLRSHAGYLRGVTGVWTEGEINPGAAQHCWPFVEVPVEPAKLLLKAGEVDVELQPAWLIGTQDRLPFIFEDALEPGRYRFRRSFFEGNHGEPYIEPL